MNPLRCSIAVVLLASVAACQSKVQPKPTTFSHVVNLSTYGLTLGEERATTTIEGQRETMATHTAFSRAPGSRSTGAWCSSAREPFRSR